MAVHPYTVTAFSTHKTTTSTDTDVLTFSKGYPFIQVVNEGATPITGYVDVGTNQAASFEPTAGADGTATIAPGATYTFTDDNVVYGQAPASIVRVKSTAAVAYSVYGLSQ